MSPNQRLKVPAHVDHSLGLESGTIGSVIAANQAHKFNLKRRTAVFNADFQLRQVSRPGREPVPVTHDAKQDYLPPQSTTGSLPKSLRQRSLNTAHSASSKVAKVSPV